MLAAYQNIGVGAASFLRSHPRAGPVILSLASASIVGHVVAYLWRLHSISKKRHERQAEAKARTKKVADTVSQIVDWEKIVKKPVHELRDDLRSGKLSALEVLHAFQKEALRISQDLNSVTEPIPEAEDLARSLDASPGFKGLLHGIPVSIKENVFIKDYDSTAGMERFIGLKSAEDAVIVKVLKQNGAIPFVRTNIPQTMLSYDCTNPLYGTSPNPQDRERTPGGSSSGEGALIGAGGSIMGVGSDIGGSVRVPAEFCGIYTLKPTAGRASKKGLFSTSKGQLVIQPTIGPMARDFDSLLLLSRAFFSPSMFELDPTLPNLPFDLKEYEKTSPMRIGFYTYDGMFQCQPPVVRAVMEAKAALEAMGHQFVHFDFPSLMGEGFNGGKYFAQLVTADRLSKVRKLIANDTKVRSISMYCRLGQAPRWLLKALQFMAGFKDRVVAMLLGAACGFRDIEEYFDRVEELEDFRDNFLQAWKSKDLDAVVCPVFACPAVKRELVHFAPLGGIYCWLYNTLNYPAGVVPVTKVTQADLDATFDPKVFKPKSFYEKLLIKSSKGSEGLSVGVQCVALPYREEVCLRVMRDLTQALAKSTQNNA